MNNTQSNLENNLINSKKSKNFNLKRSFTQEQLRDSTEENFEVQNNNDITENHIIMTDSQNSDFYLQEQFKKTPQILSLIQVFIINLEANHVTKEEEKASTLSEKARKVIAFKKNVALICAIYGTDKIWWFKTDIYKVNW